MAGNDAFELVRARGWRGGLENLLSMELGKWFKTNMWWVQGLIWLLVVNGVLAGLLFGEEDFPASDAVAMVGIFAGMFPAIAVVIIMQDALVGEKEAGTAAWVLSKPASRKAFLLSKWVANVLGVLVTMVVIPCLAAFVLISYTRPGEIALLPYLGGMGLLWVNATYYLSLTLMLGSFFNHRGPVIGIPLALAFGQQMLFGLLPALINVLPWTIVVPAGDLDSAIFPSLVSGQPLPNLMPLYVTSACIPLFLLLALWRFEKEEL
ncbi:MAG: ABC transporter permease [Chloroflexota bacterium]